MTEPHASMHPSAKVMTTTMNKELKDATNTLTKGLSNPHYFKNTRPFEYSVGAHCLSCRKLGRDHVLEREWTSILLPRLKASSLETGTRLEKEWKSQKFARQSERLELEEGMKMRRLLTRAKYEHREATLEHSSRTLTSVFQALDPIPIHPLSSSSACRTPPYIQSSSQSLPESSGYSPPGYSPPAPPQLDMSKDAEDDASHAFFKSGGSLQDIVLDNLREEEDKYMDEGSESEAEEVPENYEDDNDDIEGIQADPPMPSNGSSSLQPSARSPFQRGLNKTVGYVWLIGTLINTAVVQTMPTPSSKGCLLISISHQCRVWSQYYVV